MGSKNKRKFDKSSFLIIFLSLLVSACIVKAFALMKQYKREVSGESECRRCSKYSNVSNTYSEEYLREDMFFVSINQSIEDNCINQR